MGQLILIDEARSAKAMDTEAEFGATRFTVKSCKGL